MRNITLARRNLFKRGQNNGIKILSLGVGLAVGLVLTAKIYFEQTYDTIPMPTESAKFKRISR
jgi:putative ABC transport system permease protein